MAVTIDAAALSNSLRLGSTPEEFQEVSRLLAFATEAVVGYAPSASDVAHSEACVRLVAYLFDRPTAGRGSGWSNALRNSGAGAILATYRQSPAISTGEAEAQSTPTSAGLRQIGVESLTVATVARWVVTRLPFPAGAVFGVQTNELPIALGSIADLVDTSVASGGDASVALGTQPYALAASSVGGVIYFAATDTGTFTIRMFEHA